ncbi:MBL fold metallo-hydrolase [Halococcus saccharolyticus]|uniref:Hydrolase n=1 Tax=Halococcus saccharolyticus DSM 5350 TaxID=1227455 RepID=M0MHT6_9EURY|nr:MBL fold metallo-hydrolase [Halococcus saccharolyticus]EMA45292.1 hydrolase [Halococcus saccharolyticus DSM 5350]
MEITVLGTGSPVPTLERAGTSIAIEIDNETLLIDCGPGTTHRCIEHGVHPAEIESLFFTHQHMDHNADFFHFAIASWSLGRESLTVYGPPGTDRLLAALTDVYREDIDYRTRFYDDDGIEDIEWIETDGDLTVEGEDWRASALPVDHSIETYAYRFDTEGGSFVFSADTTPIGSLPEFAADADVLLQDACVARETTPPGERQGLVWDRLTEPMSDAQADRLSRTHCSPAEAGEIAAEAGVEMLVLTHLLPYRDTDAMVADAESTFGGEVVVAEDGSTFSV